MRTSIVLALLFSAVAVNLVGCASSSAPRGWLPSAKESRTDQYGGWIEIQLEEDEQSYRLEGEFIAVSRDSVFVADNNGLLAVAQIQIRGARITSYSSDHGALAGWTMAGSLSTISHGWVLIGTFPLWILSGTIATAARSREGKDWVERDWESYRKYARYPAGLPDHIDRSKIKAKEFGVWKSQNRNERRRDRRRR